VNELRNFKNVLLFSTVTAVGNEGEESAREGKNWDLRCRNRRIIKAVNATIKKKYKLGFSVFQIRKERENWNFVDACGEICISPQRNREIKFWLQYKIRSNEGENEIIVSIWNADNGREHQKFMTEIKELPGFAAIGFAEWDWGFDKILLRSGNDEESPLAEEIFQALRPILDAVI
jgi:hypothetical protein